ncbi:hypothetical protein IG631_12597 [Alternaria alternata]|nr:hypothetical protein IG631_12597 [Alternaria alternata]
MNAFQLSASIHRPLRRTNDRVVVRHAAESYMIGSCRRPTPTCYLACYEISDPTFTPICSLIYSSFHVPGAPSA